MDEQGALARVLRKADVLELLTKLPGADLTTLLLEAMRRRAGKLSAPDVLRRYREDRFTTPASVPFDRLRWAEDDALAAVPPGFEVLTLAPVAPLGTHSVLATVDQNKVVSTIRGSEVAADPTNAMALEAAHRRGGFNDPRSAEVVRLAALQRVVRAQRFGGRASFAHFALLGLVSAGRDIGDLAFERRHAVEHVRATADVARRCGAERLELRLTVLEPRFSPVAEAIRDALPGVDVVDDPGRESGRGYYSGFCFKLYCVDGDEWFDVADGGFVNWTQKLLANRKERLIISGVGLDRLATLSPEPPNAASAR